MQGQAKGLSVRVKSFFSDVWCQSSPSDSHPENGLDWCWAGTWVRVSPGKKCCGLEGGVKRRDC